MLEFLTTLDPSGSFGKMCQVSLVAGGGRDFGSFLGALGELGYGWSYRVLDAQYFGVAQRRKRVFVVGYLGNWKPAAEILFESESLSGNTEKGRKTREAATNESIPSVANCIQTTCNDYSRADGFNMIAVGAFGKNIADTVTAKFAKGAELLQQGAQNGGNCVLQPISFPAAMSGTQCSAAEQISNTLQAKNRTAIALQDTTGREKLQNGKGWSDLDKAYTIDTQGLQGIAKNMVVRRLTPTECERLQGFPDNYTNIPKAADGNRYKALGNSMAVPVMRWIGERINRHELGILESGVRSKGSIKLETC